MVGRLLRAVFALGLLVGLVPAVSGAPAGAAATPSISVGDTSTWEGDATSRSMAFSITLSQPSATTVTVDAMVMPGTASTPADYKSGYSVAKTLTFKPGVRTKYVTVTVVPDTVDEANETATLMLASATGGYALGRSTGTGTIFDDDPGSGVRLGVGDVSVDEGDSGTRTAKAWVTLSNPAATNITVVAAVMADTASGGTDFKPVTRSLLFKPGQVKKPVSVMVYPDTTDEPDETFMVMLSGGAGATITDSTGAGTILDDDGAANVQTESFRVGPFALTPEGQSGSQNNSGQANIPKPSGAFGIKGMRIDVVYADGTPVSHSDVHLHHIVMMDTSRPDPLCPSLPNRFAGGGAERTPLILGDDYAYKVGSTDQWNAIWHVMNMSAANQTVYIQYSIDYITGPDVTTAKGVTSYFYDVDGCWGDSEYTVPGGGGPGSIYTKSINYTAPRSGTRVFTGGHVHAGGIDTILTQDGSEVCRSTASYDMGMVHQISYCDAPVNVTAGQQITLTARYSNESQVLGAMGIDLSYVWEP